MRGMLLAGGTGARLSPLTRGIDQYLLPVGKYPLIFYPLERLKKAGIKQVLIVAARETLGPMIGILGSGADYGLELQYRVGENPMGTFADLELGKDFAREGPILVALGNQIFRDDLSQAVATFKYQTSGARLFLKKVSNPTESIIAEVESNQLLRIRPNSSNTISNPCVTGIYLFDPQVFDMITHLKTLSGEEPEITDILDIYLAKGELSFQDFQEWWVEVVDFETLGIANEYAQGVELDFK